MRGASLAQNEEVTDALVDLLNSGKSVEEVLESRRIMIQDWLANNSAPPAPKTPEGGWPKAKPVEFSPPPAGCP